jgi:hypothetical protein
MYTLAMLDRRRQRCANIRAASARHQDTGAGEFYSHLDAPEIYI